ncbi:MAG: hypothetical protein Q7K28_00660, partial [Candidatus Wildermuthbacteria bacterium]|nr:hypothetical protein [Candidatus Wildermuthbacteria bacterium]
HYKKEVEDIYDALPDEITENMKIGIETSGLSEDERRKKTNGYNDSKGNRVEGIKEKISNIAKDYSITRNEAAGILHAKGFKPKSIPGVAKQSVVSKPFQLAMRWMGSSHIQSLKENFAGETVRDCLKEGKGLNTIINRSEYDEIKSKNPTLAEWSKNTPAGKETLNWFDTFEKPELDKEERRKQDEIERKEKVKEGAAEAKAKAEKSAEEARRKASEEAKIRRGIEMEIREKRDEVDRLRKIPLPTAPPKTMPRERTERIRQLEKEIEELHRKI